MAFQKCPRANRKKWRIGSGAIQFGFISEV
jgi:hypothetical protein